MTDDANPALDALIARGVSLKATFDGLPVEGPAQIASEALERIAISPQGVLWEEEAVQEEQVLATVILTACGVAPPFSTAGAQALEGVTRLGLALYKRHAAADLASKQALGDPSTSTPPPG